MKTARLLLAKRRCLVLASKAWPFSERDAFGMKLHPMHRMALVHHPLDDAVVGGRGDFQHTRDAAAFWLSREAAQRPDKTLSYWSAACSSGKEPYTLAMCALETPGVDEVKVKLATDLSSRMLHRAVTGVYEREKFQGVPPLLLHRYFQAQGNGEAKTYRVGEALREKVQFNRSTSMTGLSPSATLSTSFSAAT